MRPTLFALALALTLTVPLSVPGQSAGAAIDRAVATWARTRTTTGTIEQTVVNTLLGANAVTHATFQQERPNRLSVRFTDAKGDAIVSDGKYLWVYLPSGSPGQVIRRSATDRGLPVDPGQFLDSPRTRFDFVDKGTATVGDRVTRAVQLTPKKGTGDPFARATVWIDETDGTIRQFEVVETNVTRRIRFQTLVINGAVNPALFRFTVPKGVKVVDGG